MSDPLGDLLTRIRNAQSAGHTTVVAPKSNLRLNVLAVLKREGYIRDYQVKDGEPGHSTINIELKYHDGRPVIQEIARVSRPGRRVYSKIKELPRYFNGLGVTILSTPRGVLSDHEARAQNVGGEILCRVY
ncbi:small subunit ribosomal protein S8 [Limibacillus halophilus]|uniref:Small ribosomal subunit protein uS8 n=2 Tax=Rhodovibrionaceae TaxID=2844403 RepID=A0A839ST67_9PROT|nr:small subunit ribosomal protein S8 [Limibacillus halophilus]